MVLLLLALPVLAEESALIVVEPAIRYQRIGGFGGGSMDQFTVDWSRRPAAERERLLDRLFTLEGDGLGWTVWRANMVGGDAPGNRFMHRKPGGSLNPLGYVKADGTPTWDGHEGTLWMVRGAAKRGATMVAYWCSPPYFMTVSGSSTGSRDGKSNNLRDDRVRDFAQHMALVLKHYSDAWQVPFRYVSPINEPNANW